MNARNVVHITTEEAKRTDGRERGEEEMSFIKKFGGRGGPTGAKLVTAMAKVG
jgi:hypothetical protein